MVAGYREGRSSRPLMTQRSNGTGPFAAIPTPRTSRSSIPSASSSKSELGLVRTQRDEVLAVVRLYKALGGG